jgi:flavin-dependent dehydrogenase
MTQYDGIVVGARCAGTALAIHLQRAGMRVLLLDADKLHSGQPFSTHALQAPGMVLLDDLGVGQRIRACTPAVHVTRFEIRGHAIDVPVAEGSAMYCPRRTTLDPLLQDAAIAAGAELRTSTRVTGLLHEGGRVCGVQAEHAGKTESYRARWVIGADGRNSSVARMVAARDYIQHETERAGYWGYWRKPACWDRDDPWRRFQTVISLDATARFAFECDGDLLVMGALAARAEVRAWGQDYQARMHAALRASPLTAALSEAQPVGSVVGLLKARFFIREAVGEGWALVGDAGLHKDPTPGHGITDALRDARALAAALVDGRSAALECYWRQRDVEAVPLYFQALTMGRLEYCNPFNELLIDAVQRDPRLLASMAEVIDRRRSPQDLVSNARAITWVLRALAQRRWDVLPPFLAAGRYNGMIRRELAERESLLARAKAKLAKQARVSREPVSPLEITSSA